MEPLKISKPAKGPWQHVDIHFCSSFPSGDYLLVVIDEYSHFPEVAVMTSTLAYSTIPKLGYQRFMQTLEKAIHYSILEGKV